MEKVDNGGDRLSLLQDAEQKAQALLAEVERRGHIVAGQTERQLSDRVYELAYELFGTRRHWHKRIVRAGANTLLPYREDPPNLLISSDDILFFDFGPVFEGWEADIGRTYVLGDDPVKRRLMADVEAGWHAGQKYFRQRPEITGSELYAFSQEFAARKGWEYGGPHCGHLIGRFPHERILGEEVRNYIHPDNSHRMDEFDVHGRPRHWVYEIHFVDRARQIGGFFEQLLTRA